MQDYTEAETVRHGAAYLLHAVGARFGVGTVRDAAWPMLVTTHAAAQNPRPSTSQPIASIRRDPAPNFWCYGLPDFGG